MHETFMRLAIKEAWKGKGKTFTNPLVGAVIVKDDQVIAKGAHLAYGQPHAEKNALTSCETPEKLLNSTLYVTLEPCHHYGKQPPCTQAILESGIKRVVIGQLDPNPLVAGKGKQYLEEQGLEVITGVLEEEVRRLNRHYNFYHEQQRPFITLKQAMTLDGKIALAGQRTPLTGEEAWKRVRKERGDYQAILIGSQTALIDNPILGTTDEDNFPPYRVVLDRKGEVLAHKELALFQADSSPVLIFTERDDEIHLPEHVEVIRNQVLSLSFVVAELTKRNIQSLYVEGGAAIHDAFLASGYWDELVTYLVPKIIGGNGTASFTGTRLVEQVTALSGVSIEQLGLDIRIVGRRV